MSDDQSEDVGVKNPVIKRGSIGYLSVYEINEYELGVFEAGGSSSTLLNFGVFSLSMAGSFVIALYTADFSKSPTVHTAFICASIIGFLLGTLCLLLWGRSYVSMRQLCKKIRARVV